VAARAPRIHGFQLTALTAYEGGDSQRAEDTDGGPSFLFASYQQTNSDQWSQDFELGWQAGQRAAVHMGAHLLGEDAHYTHVRRFPNPLLTPLYEPACRFPRTTVLTSMTYGDLEQRLRHASLWGSVDLPVSSTTTLTADVRIAYEQFSGQMRPGAWSDLVPELTPSQFIGTRDVLGFAGASTEVHGGSLFDCTPPIRCYKLIPFDRDDALWGGRLTLDHRFSESVLGYATLARGFKGAGLSPIAFEAIQGVDYHPVDRRPSVTYELGPRAIGSSTHFASTAACSSTIGPITSWASNLDPYWLTPSSPTCLSFRPGAASSSSNGYRRTHGA
jgi:outer membrane receptor protein involved in Fe transport